MKILITGGAGFIGSHVVSRYLDLGYGVVVVDDLSTGRLSNLDPRATFYQMDIQDPQLREIFFREQPEVVNHHAAQMNVRRSVADPIFDAQVNVVGSLNLIECAKAFGVRRFVYISTGGAVYGEPEYLPCDENHPINPICQYGASKHTVEHYLYMYHENYGLESIVLRYPNVYGPRQDPNGEAGVIAIFTGLMLAGKPVTINGDGEQTRDYVYVGDCARANVMALESSIEHSIFNLGSGKGTSVNEIFGHLSELTDFRDSAHNGPAKVGETRHIYLDATRATDRLGWKPEVSLAEGLAKTVAYFRESERLVPLTVQRLPNGVATPKEELVEQPAGIVSPREGEPSTSSDGR
ncbi:MAG: NAD-dependent epimerase/dehydratase family protein, partial [Anaerolineales bacterium]|nr:NAD-dependent epimerase/dehydratase family protein [Anaerolineales bacterium]